MNNNIFKDLLFDVINESELPIDYIETDDANNTLKITTTDKSQFILTTNKID